MVLQKLEEVKRERDTETKVKKEKKGSDDEPADQKKKSASVKVKKESDDDMDEPIESTPPTSDDEASGSGSDSGWVSLEDKNETAIIWLNIREATVIPNVRSLPQLCHNKKLHFIFLLC